jgi:cell wall-associated NlpC family hydrolase
MGVSALALAVSIFSGPGSAPAAADPPLTVAEAKAQVDQLEVDAAAIDQEAVGVKVRLAAGNKLLAMKQEDVRQQTANVARIRKQVGQVALAQFQNRNLDTTAQLFLTSDTDGFLNKISTVEKVSENQNTVLQDYQAEQARLADLERSAKVDVATLQAQDRELARLRVASAAKITESKAVLARLTEQERKRIAAEELAAKQAAQKAAEAAQAAQAAQVAKVAANSSASTKTSTSSTNSNPFTPTKTKSTRSTGKGAVALAYAERQLGKPYSFGAEGPGAFDCSGLTSAAWRAAGVSIPRTSQAQSTGAGRAIAKADLQPGDLVFFYSPVSHVAMYVGNGTVIHAPRPGKTVEYIKMKYMPYAGARRPG